MNARTELTADANGVVAEHARRPALGLDIVIPERTGRLALRVVEDCDQTREDDGENGEAVARNPDGAAGLEDANKKNDDAKFWPGERLVEDGIGDDFNHDSVLGLVGA